MRRFILAALVAVTSSVGHAVIFEAPDGSRIEMIVPPPYWVNKKWEGEIMVVGHPANDLTRMCSLLAGKIEILGCAFFPYPGMYPDLCWVLYNEDVPDDVRDILIEHEKAHCRGWPADHPMD